MKKIALSVLLVLAVLSIGAQLTLRGTSVITNTVTGTYADAQVDTLTWIRSGTESGATFWVHVRDSVNIKEVILRRQFNGGFLADYVGDTLLSAQSSATATRLQATINLSPYCDTMKIFVTFEDSLNGVTSASLKYGIVKKF